MSAAESSTTRCPPRCRSALRAAIRASHPAPLAGSPNHSLIVPAARPPAGNNSSSAALPVLIAEPAGGSADSIRRSFCRNCWRSAGLESSRSDCDCWRTVVCPCAASSAEGCCGAISLRRSSCSRRRLSRADCRWEGLCCGAATGGRVAVIGPPLSAAAVSQRSSWMAADMVAGSLSRAIARSILSIVF